MIIVMYSEKGGWHLAYTEHEAATMEKTGWRRDPMHPMNTVKTVSHETQNDSIVSIKRRPGRPRTKVA